MTRGRVRISAGSIDGEERYLNELGPGRGVRRNRAAGWRAAFYALLERAPAIVHHWQRDGLIEIGRGRIVVLDDERLAGLAPAR